MDKNTLANAILINKLTDSKKDLEKSIKDIKKELPVVVERLFAGLNAESKLDAVLSDVNKDYIQKLGITVKELRAEMQKIIVNESGKAKDKLIAQYKKDIASIKKPKDGKDYILTKKDLKDISKLVKVDIPDIPEVKEKTAEELLEILKLEVSDIDGLTETLKELKKNNGKNTVVGGGANRFLKNLVDVDLSGLSIVDGKYVLGSGSGGGGTWGSITGTLSDQTDLQTALDGKVDDSQVLTDVPADAVFTDTVYDDTAIQAEVDLNTAKVSFPEAPEDGKQYARIDGTWVEVSGGGGGAIPIQRVPGAKTGITYINQAGKIGNDLFIGFNGTIHKLTRFADGVDYILNSDNGTTANWSIISGLAAYATLNDDTDLIYYTTTTANEIKTISTVDKSITSLTVSGGTFPSASNIVSDGTDLLILDATNTVLKRFSISGTTATFVEDITLPFTPGYYYYSSSAMLGNYVYYWTNGSGGSSKLVKFDVINETSESFDDYNMRAGTTLPYSNVRCLFSDGNYVYIVNATYDSEDYNGFVITTVDKL